MLELILRKVPNDWKELPKSKFFAISSFGRDTFKAVAIKGKQKGSQIDERDKNCLQTKDT